MTNLFPNNEIKKQINTMICPLCHCSLEGTPRKATFTADEEDITLYCAQNRGHYMRSFIWNVKDDPVIIKALSELLVLRSDNLQYSLWKDYRWALDIGIILTITRVNGDGEAIEELMKIYLPRESFDFTDTQEKILKRLKLLSFFT